MEWVSLALSVVAGVAAVWAVVVARDGNRIAYDANRKSDEANRVAQDANTLAEQANELSNQANELAKRANELSRRATEVSERTEQLVNEDREYELVCWELLATRSGSLIDVEIINRGRCAAELVDIEVPFANRVLFIWDEGLHRLRLEPGAATSFHVEAGNSYVIGPAVRVSWKREGSATPRLSSPVSTSA